MRNYTEILIGKLEIYSKYHLDKQKIANLIQKNLF